MRQLIIVRKDLNMSIGKTAAQVAHASLSYFMNIIKNNIRITHPDRYLVYDVSGTPIEYKNKDLRKLAKEAADNGQKFFTASFGDSGKYEKGDDNHKYIVEAEIDSNIYENWMCGIYTKTVCGAKNKAQLLKAAEIAKELGLKEDEDFFIIKDACLTELNPEDIDETGAGYTVTCIGFRPLPDDIAHQISKKYQLF